MAVMDNAHITHVGLTDGRRINACLALALAVACDGSASCLPITPSKLLSSA